MNPFPRHAGQPVAEPLTLPEVLTHLREDAGVQDAYLTALISVAREACEDRTERTLIETPLLLTLDGFPEVIELRRPPVLSVQSVSYIDPAGVQQTLDPADYLLDRVSEPGYLVPAPGKAWPETQDHINAVTVTYKAGYGGAAADVPRPLRQWMLLAIGDMYAMRNASSEKPRVPNEFADALLSPYRIWGL